MKTNLDPKFVARLTNLTREVLRDEARFVSRNDQTLITLHRQIFSKNEQVPLVTLKPMERQFFNKYFYFDNNPTTPRTEVPFSDSPKDQEFFFEQLRQQFRICTYNLDRMDYLRPTFADDKAEQPAFSTDQENLLFRGVVQPFLHSLEQREIDNLEKQKGGKPSKDDTNNPYKGLGQKLLVKGQSGQFDTVLTYDQLVEITKEQSEIAKKGLFPGDTVKQLREFLAKRFPELHIYIDDQGNITTFQSTMGIGANGQLVKGKTTMSFTEALHEMKLRQGHELQYQAIIASKGMLSLSGTNFKVGNASQNGYDIGLNEVGENTNAIFFVTDRQGVLARIVINTTKQRLGDPVDYQVSIYQSPAVDDPAAPKFSVDQANPDKFQTPLLALYSQAKAVGKYNVAGANFKPKFPGDSPKAPDYARKPADQPSEVQIHEDTIIGNSPQPLIPKVIGFGPTSVDGKLKFKYEIKPKVKLNPPAKASPQPSDASVVGKSEQPPQQVKRPPLPKIKSQNRGSADVDVGEGKKKGSHKLALVTGVTVMPIVTTALGSLIYILMK